MAELKESGFRDSEETQDLREPVEVCGVIQLKKTCFQFSESLQSTECPCLHYFVFFIVLQTDFMEIPKNPIITGFIHSNGYLLYIQPLLKESKRLFTYNLSNN